MDLRNSLSHLLSSRNQKNILILITLTGSIIAILQWLQLRSLWIDEALLANNIIEREFNELLEFLDNNQSAPIGYLMAQKVFLKLFGIHELSLRVFPLLAFFASFPIIYRIGQKAFREYALAGLFSMALFSINIDLIYYASEVKPYGIDMFMSLLIIHQMVCPHRSDVRQIVVLLILGAIGIWFSNILVTTLVGAGLVILKDQVWRNKQVAYLLPLIGWAISFGIYFLYFIHENPLKEYMLSYWKDYLGHPSFFSVENIRFIYEAFSNSAARAVNMGIGTKTISSLFVIAGIFGFFKYQKKTWLMLLLCPFVIHTLLSLLEFYPFQKRLSLYLVPHFILLHVFGLVYCLKSSNLFKPLALLVACSLAVICVVHHPSQKEELNDSIEYMQRNLLDEDLIYVYYASVPTFQFYQHKHPEKYFPQIVRGTKHREEPSKYVHEIPNSTSTVWLLFSHVYNDNNPGNEAGLIVNDMIKNGYEIKEERTFARSQVYKLTKAK